jgi:DNA helicase-2/ATP-dependent DNA helicase PcrA
MSALSHARERINANPAQAQAFAARGHCIVAAPPGSGKTELLCARLAQDFIDVIAEPQGAACITYSNTAAAELRRRLDQFGVQRRSNLFIGTVHGFALSQVIRPFARLLGEEDLATAAIATVEQRGRIFDTARETIYPDEPGYGLRSTMDRRRRALLLDETAPMYGGERVAEMTRLYERLLRDEGLIDFDEMVSSAVAIVEGHRVVRQVLAARFPKLFIDEYQDLGAGLHQLVKILCFDQAASSTLFAVADPDQCIYMFSGASPELVSEIAERGDVEHVQLHLNYRSSDEIIRQSLKLLPGPLEVQGFREGGLVELHQADGGVAGQATAAMAVLRDALQAGAKPEALAVLCLSNNDCVEVGDLLIESGLSVFVRREDDYPRTAATQFVEMAAAWATSTSGTSGVALRWLLAQWRQQLGTRWSRAVDVGLVTLLLDGEELSDTPARDFVARVGAIGLTDALAAERVRSEDSDSLTALLASTTDGSLCELSVADLGDRAFARNRIHVLTMHAAKGLEFDTVCLLGLEHTRLPWFKAAQWEVVQDRRKFYVAITRARYEVHMFYTGWMITKYGKRWDHGPSSFVSQLGLSSA